MYLLQKFHNFDCFFLLFLYFSKITNIYWVAWAEIDVKKSKEIDWGYEPYLIKTLDQLMQPAFPYFSVSYNIFNRFNAFKEFR